MCIRIETFENKESEAQVRELLNGRYANTAFALFDPQGERKLSRSGRSPSAALAAPTAFTARGGSRSAGDDAIITQLFKVAANYTPTKVNADANLQDFHSFRQALNVAAADQRLLVLVDVKASTRKQVEANLKQVFSSADIVGKFHLNFIDAKVDRNWSKSIEGTPSSTGIFIVRAGTFGIDGVVMQQLPDKTSPEDIKSALVAANDEFSVMETRKKYSQHVQAGKRQGIYFENEISRAGTSDHPKQNRSQRRR